MLFRSNDAAYEMYICDWSSDVCSSDLISQEAGQVVWYSHLFQNFPQLIVIHIVKGFGIVNKAEIDAFLELSCFIDNPTDFGIFDLWFVSLF